MAQTDRATGLVGETGIKEPVRVATTANITLSGEQTIDGVAVVDGDRVLVKDQTTAANNGIYCVDPQTEILTKAGFKKHDDLVVGEDVLTLNMETGKSEWQPVLSVHEFPVHDTEMLSMEGNCHSSLSTMNHRWPVSRRHPPLSLYPRRRVANGTFALSEMLSDQQYMMFKESADLNNEDYILLSADCANLPDVEIYQNALVELIAWFITEGHIRKRNSGALSTCVDIVQSQAVNPDKVCKIRSCLTDLFGPAVEYLKRKRNGVRKPEWREKLTGSGRMMEFSLNREAGKILCELAPHKIARADFISSLTKMQLDLFIDTCIAADGTISIRSGQRIFIQKCAKRLAPVQMACALRGIPTNVYKKSDDADDVYVMTLLKRKRALPISNGKITKYSGIVWCPKTGNKTWMARRNGSVFFTGNTVDTGTWSRTKDCNGAYDLVNGTLVYVRSGTTNGNKIFKCTATAPITIGTTSLTFVAMDIEISGQARVVWCGTATGTANALTLTPSVAVTILTAGLTLLFKSGSSANSGATTIAVSSLTATAVQSNGSAMVGGEIEANKWYMAIYEGTAFQILKYAPALMITGGTMTGDIIMSGSSIFDANASIAAHATTMDPWSLGNYATLTGSAVTFTAMANAPQAGAEVELYMNAAHVFTDGAVFEVDGDANYTATIGDRVLLRAKSTTVITVHPRKKDGTAVVGSSVVNNTGCSVYHSTTQSVNTATWTTLTWDSENYDDDTYHSTVTNPSRITVNFTGRIQLRAAVADLTNSSTERGSRFLENGVATNMPVFTHYVSSANNTINKVVDGEYEKDCNSGDYFEVQWYQASGGAINALGGNGVSFFQMTRIK